MPKHPRLTVTQTRIADLSCLYQTLFAFPFEDIAKTNRQIQRNASLTFCPPSRDWSDALSATLKNESFLLVIHTFLAHTHTTLFHGDGGTRLYS